MNTEKIKSGYSFEINEANSMAGIYCKATIPDFFRIISQYFISIPLKSSKKLYLGHSRPPKVKNLKRVIIEFKCLLIQ